ncbi:hypothetical protein SFRURICE_006619 [Spodoptera frugiperda]|nr:hypothetical protein SFRURICE_006619 [Spodoptera frugiperda]
MVLTRSRSGESRGEQTQQELSVTAGPGANTPAPESSSARVTDTGSGSTATTNIDATLKPSDTRSRRSTCSKKKRLAELEAIEQLQLADMEVQQTQARRRLKEIQLQRLRVEAESSDDEELEDDLASVRIGTWLARPAPPPGGETRPPPHDASGGRISRDAAHAARATYTGAPAGAHPLRDDDGYGKVRESVCAQTKGNIASEVSHGNVSDRLIDVRTLAAALAQVMRSSREPPKFMQRLPVFDGKPAAPAPPAMTTHESVTSARETTSPHNRRAYLKIVPVTLSGPHASLHTYALLDDGSTVTLLDASAADILGADGPESSMCIQGLEPRIPKEDLHKQTLGVLEKKSRRLPDGNFKKKKQEAPTVPKSHLGTLERLDKNEPRSKESRVITATQDNRATPCDSSLSVPSTCSAGARILRLRGKIKSVQEVNWNIINPVVPEHKKKYKKLRDNGNTTCPYPRLGRHKVKRNNSK